MKKPRFKIGEWVRAENTVTFCSNLEPNNPERVMAFGASLNGVVVGSTTRFIGAIMNNRHFENASLINRKSVQVWQIRQGYSNKPYEALNEDVVSLENDKSDDGIILLKGDIPFRYNSEWYGVNGGVNRQNLSDNMKFVERDEKGRFV